MKLYFYLPIAIPGSLFSSSVTCVPYKPNSEHWTIDQNSHIFQYLKGWEMFQALRVVLAPRFHTKITAKYKGSGRWKHWGIRIKIGVVNKRITFLSLINSYRWVNCPHSRLDYRRGFKWTQIDLLQLAEVCTGHVIVNRAGILVIRDLVAIKIAITGVP